MKTARTLNNKTYYFVSSVKQFTDNRVPLSFLCISKSDTKRHNHAYREDQTLPGHKEEHGDLITASPSAKADGEHRVLGFCG